MKSFILFLLLTLFGSINSFAQSDFHCDKKMTEMGDWRVVDVDVAIDKSIISVIELAGIELRLTYDGTNYSGSNLIYTYTGLSRMIVTPTNQSTYMLLILSSHYLCKKTNLN